MLQKALKSYKDEDINFFAQNSKKTSQSASKNYKDRGEKLFF